MAGASSHAVEGGRLRPPSGEDHGRHPWWSRVLYALYGVFACIAAWYAYAESQTTAALVSAGIAAVLLWKAAQKVR